jgi:hypothetical protein
MPVLYFVHVILKYSGCVSLPSYIISFRRFPFKIFGRDLYSVWYDDLYIHFLPLFNTSLLTAYWWEYIGYVIFVVVNFAPNIFMGLFLVPAIFALRNCDQCCVGLMYIIIYIVNFAIPLEVLFIIYITILGAFSFSLTLLIALFAKSTRI